MSKPLGSEWECWFLLSEPFVKDESEQYFFIIDIFWLPTPPWYILLQSHFVLKESNSFPLSSYDVMELTVPMELHCVTL